MPVQAPKGTLIAFSTSPSDGARDGGLEGHSIYTGALLKYIGRESLSVEELFKKVRKTVYNLTEGKQTTWEHTSLIGDFYFNTGQLVYSLELPYDESVVKDNTYDSNKDEFSHLIGELKSYNWDWQNRAIDKLLACRAGDLDRNQQFILGRNLLQAGSAFHVASFFERLSEDLRKYSKEGENHVLNGILFEIYFDSFGQFRQNKIKNQHFEEVMALRTNPTFAKSFDFIRSMLGPHRDQLYWIPDRNDKIIDVDILASSQKVQKRFGGEDVYEVISKINVPGQDITELVADRYGGIIGKDVSALTNAIANYLNAPVKLIQINSNISIKNIAFADKKEKSEEPW